MTIQQYDDKCPICNETLTEDHLTSEQHRFNLLIKEWEIRREGLVKNRHNIEIEASADNFREYVDIQDFNKNHGTYTVEVQQDQLEKKLNNEIIYKFTILNKNNNSNILLTHCDTLHPLANFQLIDVKGQLKNDELLEIPPGRKYKLEVKFRGNILGEFCMAVAFSFVIEKSDKKNESFTIVREIRIIIKNEFGNFERLSGKSPFNGKDWDYRKTRDFPAIGNNPILDYTVPPYLINIFKYGFDSNYLKHDDYLHAAMVRDVVTKDVTPGSYSDFFHFLLWMDEIGAQIKVEKYNMEQVPITLWRDNMIQLDVPGLGEKRPSLVVLDDIWIRIGNEIYGGFIRYIYEENIKIKGIHPRLLEKVDSAPDGTLLVDVKFSIGRLPYARKHNAVALCCFEEKMQILFPSTLNNKLTKQNYEISKFYNKKVAKNEEQMKAVRNIVNNTSGTSPFIVFGPPGTGKTITIVEAIVQITRLNPSAKILICAPSNAACDMLTLKLINFFQRSELIRIHSESCDWSTVPEEIKNYSNRGGEMIIKYKGEELSKFRVVVTTLVSAGKYANDNFSRTHVFVDEAAQAQEPEAIISIGGILLASGQLVLAGDPKQLAPLTNSTMASKYGLEISLMERLMKLEMYQPSKENSDYIVKLKRNYRSHGQIIHIPNHLFYNRELEAVSQEARDDRISKINIPVDGKKITPQAVEFFGASGKEEKEGMSPSYFNRREISIVMQYVKLLLEKNCGVLPEEIGIIAPYIRQVAKIRYSLEKQHINGIEVGTTEAFQGREKRVIIISTVRAQADLLLHDNKYKIGFVGNERRFNVAITRAMGKLIIVGNPHVLCYSKIWLSMIKFCQNMNSYRGCYFAERNLELKESIVKRMDKVSMIDSQYAGQFAEKAEKKRKSKQNRHS